MPCSLEKGTGDAVMAPKVGLVVLVGGVCEFDHDS